jgi:hypothetical protein
MKKKFFGIKGDRNSEFLWKWMNKFIPEEIDSFSFQYIGDGLYNNENEKITLPSDLFPVIKDEKDIGHCGKECFEWAWNYVQNDKFKNNLKKSSIEESLKIMSEFIKTIHFLNPNDLIEQDIQQYEKRQRNYQSNLITNQQPLTGSRLKATKPKTVLDDHDEFANWKEDEEEDYEEEPKKIERVQSAKQWKQKVDQRMKQNKEQNLQNLIEKNHEEIDDLIRHKSTLINDIPEDDNQEEKKEETKKKQSKKKDPPKKKILAKDLKRKN